MSFEDIIKTLGSGLGQFGWNDLLDIAILTVLIYKLIVWTKDTRAYEVLKGVGFLIVASAAAQFLSLYTLSWLLDSILQSGTIIIVIFILFTPEIRRVLERLGRSGKAIGKLISEAGNMGVEDLIKLISEAGNMGVEDLIDDLHKTILRLSRRRVGALIVFEQKTGLGDIISTGTAIEGLVSGALIENIFEPNTPLHDGAVICRGSTLVAAACFLPLSEETGISRELGTRHRAALGVSTVSDCLVLVVSEETGAISMAHDGKLVRYLDSVALRHLLESIFLKKGIGSLSIGKNQNRRKEGK